MVEYFDIKQQPDNANIAYKTTENLWQSKSAHLINELLNPKRKDIVLDIGCGSGKQMIELSDHIKLGIGIDINDGIIEQATINSIYENKDNVEFYKGSFNKPDMVVNIKEKHITKIISNFAFHYLNIQGKKQAIEKMIEIGGKSLQSIIIGDLIFFEAPYCFNDEIYQNKLNTENKKQSSVKELIDCFSNFSFNFVVHQLHPMVGVLQANKN